MSLGYQQAIPIPTVDPLARGPNDASLTSVADVDGDPAVYEVRVGAGRSC